MTKKMKEFTQDQLQVLAKACQNIGFGASQLSALVQKEKLTTESAHTVITYLENNLIDAAEILDYASHLAVEQERRYAEIRTANETIRALQKQLGSTKPIDGLPEQLKMLSNRVRDWWNKEGFHHVSEIIFHPYGGMEVQFCFMLDHYRSHSKTPDTDKRTRDEHIAHIRTMGFEFADFEEGRSEKLKLLDTPHNRALCLSFLRKRFPSISVTKWENHSSYANGDVFVLDCIHAMINELADI